MELEHFAVRENIHLPNLKFIFVCTYRRSDPMFAVIFDNRLLLPFSVSLHIRLMCSHYSRELRLCGCI